MFLLSRRSARLRFNVVRAAQADAERCAAVHARAFDAPWPVSDFVAWLGADGVAGHLAWRGQEALGLSLYRMIVDEAELLTLCAAPEARRAGVGRALLAAALKHARASGARVMHLEVAVDNDPARALYDAAGFVSVGRRAGYYQVGDAAVDAITMSRALSGPNAGSRRAGFAH